MPVEVTWDLPVLCLNAESVRLKAILRYSLVLSGASLIAQLIKNPPAMQETPVQFLGREDPLE